MTPDYSNMNRVLDRMGEIARRCSQPFEFQHALQGTPPASRFVDVLDKLSEPDAGKGASGRAAMDDLRRQVSRSAEKYNIDEELIRAVIQVESGWRSDSISSKGARGLMQLMPGTAKMLGVEDAFDPEQNIEGGVKYLAQLTDKYNGDVEMALAAYNAGPSRVNASGGIPFAETARYVKNVMALYHRYREEE